MHRYVLSVSSNPNYYICMWWGKCTYMHMLLALLSCFFFLFSRLLWVHLMPFHVSKYIYIKNTQATYNPRLIAIGKLEKGPMQDLPDPHFYTSNASRVYWYGACFPRWFFTIPKGKGRITCRLANEGVSLDDNFILLLVFCIYKYLSTYVHTYLLCIVRIVLYIICTNTSGLNVVSVEV